MMVVVVDPGGEWEDSEAVVSLMANIKDQELRNELMVSFHFRRLFGTK